MHSEKIQEIRQRLEDFWNQKYTGRALLAVTAPKQPGQNISMFHNDDATMHQRPQELKKHWENPETILKNTIRRIHRTHYAGEAFPAAFLNFGTSGHCNYLGAKPTYGNDTIWFDPAYSDLDQIPAHPDLGLLQKHLAIAEYLAQNSEGRYIVGMPDHTGSLDSVAHLFGSSQLLLEMLQNPQKVLDAGQKADHAWELANQAFHDTIQPLNAGGAHAWMQLIAPGRLQHLQCDLSVMISPEMYHKFVLPELRRQLEWTDYSVYHFDGIEQQRHLDLILGLKKLNAIQWTEVAGQPSPAHFIPVLRRMQQAGKNLIIMCPPGDLRPLLQNLSANGLYLHTTAETPEQAELLLRLVEKHSRP